MRSITNFYISLAMLFVFLIAITVIAIVIIVIIVKDNQKSRYGSKKGRRQKERTPVSNRQAEYQKRKGTRGEYQTALEINKLLPDAKILMNTYIPNKNGYTEIDIIVIAIQAIYVIENKNYSGWIFGSEQDQYWTVTFPHVKHQFYNPVKQNNTHIFYLKNLLNKNGYRCDNINSIICFNEEASLKKIISNTPVIKTKDIKYYINLNHRSYSREEVESIYKFLLPYSQQSTKIKNEHINRIRESY